MNLISLLLFLISLSALTQDGNIESNLKGPKKYEFSILFTRNNFKNKNTYNFLGLGLKHLRPINSTWEMGVGVSYLNSQDLFNPSTRSLLFSSEMHHFKTSFGPSYSFLIIKKLRFKLSVLMDVGFFRETIIGNSYESQNEIQIDSYTYGPQTALQFFITKTFSTSFYYEFKKHRFKRFIRTVTSEEKHKFKTEKQRNELDSNYLAKHDVSTHSLGICANMHF
ncbi:MAG: hypothetical protein H6622_15680 [Halobacteriovoraceae bacterium]|nr:hypothetical protein [Halobacteriovoraceae bacterium]